MVALLASNDSFGLLNVKVPLDNNGNSPLHYAAQKDAYGVLTRLLLLAGFDPDLHNYKGITPLMIAAEDKVNRSKQDNENDGFTDDNQQSNFLDILDFSNKPCDPVPDKYPENAGVTVYDIALKNPSLKMSDNSGAEKPAIGILNDQCSK